MESTYMHYTACQVEWVCIKEGTGAMLTALEEDRVDMIVALTEGLVGAIARGSDVALLGTYVQSPLCWAISVGAGMFIFFSLLS